MQRCVRGDIIAYFFSLSFPLSLWSSSSFLLYFHPLRVHNISLVVVCVSRLGNASLWPLTPPLLWALVFVWIAYPQCWGVIMGLRRVFSTKGNCPPPSLFCPLISLWALLCTPIHHPIPSPFLFYLTKRAWDYPSRPPWEGLWYEKNYYYDP